MADSGLTEQALRAVCQNISMMDKMVFENKLNNNGSPPTPLQVWLAGLVSVTLISLCATVGILLMPFLSLRFYNRALTYFVGLGVGSLCGSSIFHLMPQAFNLLTLDVNHRYLSMAWLVVIGVYMFFFVDKLLKLIMSSYKQRPNKPGFTLVVGSTEASNCGDDSSTAYCKYLVENGAASELETTGFTTATTTTDTTVAEHPFEITPHNHQGDNQTHGMCAHDHDVRFKKGDSVIGTVAWMIVFGDGLHNLIDGLSIGAAFSSSIVGGVSVSVAVLCEEFPHELGDVAILVNAGMSLRQALTYNLLSACTCYIGFVVGVLVGEMPEAQQYIFGLAAGMFLYISLASMVPEMNKAMEEELAVSRWRGVGVLGLQTLGILTGLSTMFLMSKYGSDIRFD